MLTRILVLIEFAEKKPICRIRTVQKMVILPI